MDFLKIMLSCLAILPLGLGSIHTAEVLRWYEPRRGLRLIVPGSFAAFACACALIVLYRGVPFGFDTYLETVVQMAFATYFLVALVYLLHCVAWVITRLGRRVPMDELFSRLVVLTVFSLVDLGAYLVLVLAFVS